MGENPTKRRRTLQSHGSIDFFYDVVQWTIPLDESAPACKSLQKGNRIESPHFSFNKRKEWHLEMRMEMDKILIDLRTTDIFIVTHLGWKNNDGFVREDPGYARRLDLQRCESDKLMAATCRLEREERRRTMNNVGEAVPLRVLENTSRNTFGVVDHFSEVVEWKIPDFLSLQRSCIESPLFRLAGSQWRMTVYLDGLKSDSYLWISLQRGVSNTSTKAFFYVGLLTQNFNALQEIKRGDTEDSAISEAGTVWGWSRFLCLEELRERRFITSMSGSLTFTCRVERTASSTSSNVPPLPLPSRSLLNPGSSTSFFTDSNLNHDQGKNACSLVKNIVCTSLTGFHEHKMMSSTVNLRPSTSSKPSTVNPGPSTSSQPSPVNPGPSTSSKPSPFSPATKLDLRRKVLRRKAPPQESLLVDLENLSSDLKDLLSSGRTCDFTISVQGKEFRAHRAILSARSPVFRHMLEHDTPEAQSGIVNVSDCHRDSFGQFMDFLYTGKIEDMSFEAALHLYATAEKYDVRRLKSFCADYLKQNLSV